MTIEANDFYEIADEIMDKGRQTGKEIYYRTTASRAYYGSLHQCKNLLSQKYDFHQAEGEHSHQQVINALYRHNLNELAISLSRMRTYRVRADYQLNEIFTKKDAESMLREAQNVSDILPNM
ncbi:conserved hypothetical protein [Beggiatoa sp. PS]|nr:conserved hypothetical protein [Beggiatoa sp. PS]